jgi:DNA-binding transcriptional regulator LsrR (DeoR family)
MRRPLEEARSALILKAAYLKAHGQRQTVIARRLRVSPPEIVRLLKQAKAQGLLEETITFKLPSGASRQLRRELDGLLRHEHLGEALASLSAAPTLRSLRVVDSGGEEQTEAAIDARQIVFGRNAAPFVLEQLRQAPRVVAISWGSTCSRLVDALVSRGPRAGASRSPRAIIPVSGEPMRYAHNAYTSSTLARRLDQAINGEPRRSRSAARPPVSTREQYALTGVPAFIPRDPSRFLPADQVRASKIDPEAVHGLLRSFMENFIARSSKTYERIFTEPDGLMWKADALVTSVGTAEKPMGFCNDDLLEFGDLDRAELRRLVVGDVGGVLLARPGLSDKDALRVHALADMWTGITMRQLQHLVRRSATEGTPGVVVLAMGASRNEVVREILRRNLCNQLVIDLDLANQLSRDLAAEPAGARGEGQQD